MLEIRLCRSFCPSFFLIERARSVSRPQKEPTLAAPVGRVVPIVGVCFARPRPRVSLSIVREWALPNYEFPTQNRGDKKRVGRRLTEKNVGLGRQQTNMQEYQTTGGICAVLAAGMGKNVGSLAGQAFEARGGEDSSDHLPAVGGDLIPQMTNPPFSPPPSRCQLYLRLTR